MPLMDEYDEATHRMAQLVVLDVKLAKFAAIKDGCGMEIK
jgi:hypothetical protein